MESLSESQINQLLDLARFAHVAVISSGDPYVGPPRLQRKAGPQRRWGFQERAPSALPLVRQRVSPTERGRRRPDQPR